MKASMWFAGALAASLLTAGSAFAFTGGQVGFSGVDPTRTCLNCHGPSQEQYARIAGTGEVANCSPNDGGEDFEIPLVTVGTPSIFRVTAESPPTPGCPLNDCCDGAAAGDECLLRPGSNRNCAADAPDQCCTPGFTTCGDPLVGFNVAVDGVGTIQAPGSRASCIATANCDAATLECPNGATCNEGDICEFGDQALCNDGEACTEGVCIADDVRGEPGNEKEVTHVVAKTVANATWDVEYIPPADLTAVNEGPTVFVGMNVANGNGFDDALDLNSVFRTPVALTDGTAFRLPGGCLVCGDDRRPAINGGCCSCVSASPSRSLAVTGALLAGLGVVFVGRRRRRQ